MKKVISLGLVMVMMLGIAGVVACGGEVRTTPSQSVLTWDDIPVYPGARQVEEINLPTPPVRAEWTKIEWRYYKTGKAEAHVSSFYRNEMLSKGWRQDSWGEYGKETTGYYSKNNEQDGAIVYSKSVEDGTIIALMRAIK